jgi:hypothetical protein
MYTSKLYLITLNKANKSADINRPLTLIKENSLVFIFLPYLAENRITQYRHVTG